METDLLEWLKDVRVLLIDDNDMVLRALRTAFEYSGCLVKTVSTAEEGLVVLDQEPFDLILCDYQLPGVNGVQFFRRARPHTQKAANILISAFRFGDISHDGEQAGIDAYFEKPFSIRSLYQRVFSLRNEKRFQKLQSCSNNPAISPAIGFVSKVHA
jgi:DNA-binding response OmpR family regulator